MAEKHLMKYSTFLVSREMPIKTILRIHSHQSDWQRSNTQVTADAGKDVEKEELSSIVGGLTCLYKHSRNQSGGSSENWTQYYWRILQYLSWAYIQKMFQPVRNTHAPLCS